MWDVRWSVQSMRDLDGLDVKVARHVFAKVMATRGDPRRFFERLAGSDQWKLRVGDVRVLALLAFDTRVILVEAIDKRSRVYK